MFCAKCGTQFPNPQANFCQNCGTPRQVSAQQPQQQPMPPQQPARPKPVPPRPGVNITGKPQPPQQPIPPQQQPPQPYYPPQSGYPQQGYPPPGYPAHYQQPQQQVQFETCEIMIKKGFMMGDYFSADAIGARGSYEAGKTHGLGKDIDTDKAGIVARSQHQSLVNKLLKEGWQQDGRGSHWYSIRFKRPIR